MGLLQLPMFDDAHRPAVVPSATDEWYTPPQFIDAAWRVLGGIDLDPASSQRANCIVRATRYYSAADDGLAHVWRGRVWMNPPYSNAGAWVDKLLAEYAARHVSAAIFTIYANTEAGYFQPLWDHPICFARGRLSFIAPDGRESSVARKGSVFVYLGDNDDLFRTEFGRFGRVGRLR